VSLHERWWILARTDFRAAAARRLSEERELSPVIVSLLSPDSPTRSVGVRIVPLDHIEANPQQPRLAYDKETLDELAASIREHGVLQPILVRPVGPNTYQLIAGERRWRASKLAGLDSIPALIEEIDDDTALEISIIENLQREDISPLDEAAMYDRMVREHGYSIRKLADKLGKDKGYLENRLRLADAPEEVRALVSLRKDTLSHAYELMKVQDPKRRRRLADQVARGELTLIKLREKIEGRRARVRPVEVEVDGNGNGSMPTPIPIDGIVAEVDPELEPEPDVVPRRRRELDEDSLVNAKASLGDALDELVDVLRTPEAVEQIPDVDRDNLAKYLTIAKLKLENAIAIVRTGDIGD
jgi:ParB/RepB/Spo0J family partition protein